MNLYGVPTKELRVEDRRDRKDLGQITEESMTLKDEMENLKKALPDYLKFLVPGLLRKRYDDEILNKGVRDFNADWATDQHRNNIDVMGVLRSLYSSEGPYSQLKR